MPASSLWLRKEDGEWRSKRDSYNQATSYVEHCLGSCSETEDTKERVEALPPYPLARAVFAGCVRPRVDGAYPPVHLNLCCVKKFRIRAADLALCARNLARFTISKGDLVEADIPPLVGCEQLTDLAFNFNKREYGGRVRGAGSVAATGGGGGGLPRVVFSRGFPALPPSLKTLDLGAIEDSAAHPCSIGQVLCRVRWLESLTLENMVLRESLQPAPCFRTLEKLNLVDMPGLILGAAFWSACPSLQSVEITGPDSSLRNASGGTKRGCCPFPSAEDVALPPSLRSLAIARMEVRSLPESVCACESLNSLVVTDCGLRELPRSLWRLTSLTVLSLCSNDLTVDGITPLARCAFLNEKLADGRDAGAVSLGGNEATLGDGVPTNKDVIAYLAGVVSMRGGDGLRRFAYADLSAASSGFDASELIADDGSFGPVYHGKFGSSQHVAIKVMRDVTTHNDEQLRRELSALRHCRHPNLVQLVGYSDDGPDKCIVYVHKARGCLRRTIERGGDELPWRRRVCILSQILSALEYLHTQADPPIVHRDVKSGNVLLDSSLNASLGDFGLARISPEASASPGIAASTRIFGTPGYVDPEYAQTGRVSTASDMFSLGVVALELLSSDRPYDPARDPPVLLDRFEESDEDGTLEAFAERWPAEPALQLCAMVKAWTHRRGRRRPTAAAACLDVTAMCERWACGPIQLAANGRCGAVCVVCDEETATHAFIPCGHKCVCRGDANELIRRGMPCPMCRAPAERAIRIFE